jgi:aldose 1-epimerase
MRVRLKLDSLEADLAPETGGSIAAFRRGGRAIFREADEGAGDVLAMGEFPMAPYVNRIAQGRFCWRNETITLPQNADGQPHPLHGIGWRAKWACERLTPHAAVMTLDAPASVAWPWRVAMAREVRLRPDGIQIGFKVTNADARPMPASIGLHPYFPADSATVRLAVAAQVLADESGIPVRRERTEVIDMLAKGAPAEALALDHCFSGWDGSAEIVWPDMTLRIATEPPQGFVQIYTPPGERWFCLEPQSAMPDAVNQALEGGVRELDPGDSLAFTTRLTVLP